MERVSRKTFDNLLSSSRFYVVLAKPTDVRDLIAGVIEPDTRFYNLDLSDMIQEASHMFLFKKSSVDRYPTHVVEYVDTITGDYQKSDNDFDEVRFDSYRLIEPDFYCRGDV